VISLPKDIKKWVHQYADELNKTQDVNILEKYIAKDYIWHLAGNKVIGLEGVKKDFASSMPYQLVVEDVAVDGNTVVVRWSFVRTDPKTGVVRRSSGFTYDILRDGLFAEGWEIGSDKPWG
jgi:hypothetical protein